MSKGASSWQPVSYFQSSAQPFLRLGRLPRTRPLVPEWVGVETGNMTLRDPG